MITWDRDPSNRARDVRAAALAYRIWCYANAIGWNCTTAEIAEALGVSAKTVGMTLFYRGWRERVRGVAVTGSRRRETATSNFSGNADILLSFPINRDGFMDEGETK